MAKKNKKKKNVSWKRLKGITNFYPTYVDGNRDEITPTSPIFRTEFQTVIPRYNLSMTETRDKGTGPTFLETEYKPTENSNKKDPPKRRESKSSKTTKKLPHHTKKKIRTDFWE